jgi:ribosomal protein L35
MTKKGKILFRAPRQNHFNAKESGNQTRQKRGFQVMSKSESRIFKKMLSN